jgi:hypothetical protein
VAKYLILEKKVDPSRVLIVPYGESAPLADNRTEEGRAKNRRAEIRVYTEEVTIASTSAGAQRSRQSPRSARITCWEKGLLYADPVFIGRSHFKAGDNYFLRSKRWG